MQQGLDTHVGNAIDFGFVERFDFESRGDVHAIDEGKPIAGFADGTGGDDADLFLACDAEFLHQSAVAFQDTGAFLDTTSRDRLGCKSVFPNRDGLGDFFEGTYLALVNDFGNCHSDTRRTDVDDCDEPGRVGRGCYVVFCRDVGGHRIYGNSGALVVEGFPYAFSTVRMTSGKDKPCSIAICAQWSNSGERDFVPSTVEMSLH